MHPIDIAQEVKSFTFFSGFDESLLHQVCTMMMPVTFEKNEEILQQNQLNNRLFFLREGLVEVLYDSEKVAEFNKVGEVFGEMSVIRSRPTSTSVRAANHVECFMIDSANFKYIQPGQKERFELLLYKVYAQLLTERLEQTNEKAKRFEIIARELEKAKKEIEILSESKMSFLLQESSTMSHKQILIAESQKNNQNLAKQSLMGLGLDIDFCDSDETLHSFLHGKQYDIIFVEDKFISALKNVENKGRIVILSDIDPKNFNHTELNKYNHLITRNFKDRTAAVRSYLNTLSKLLQNEHFGIERYLSPKTNINNIKIRKSSERKFVIERVSQYLQEHDVRINIIDKVKIVLEESLMNAIYDAPTTPDHHPRFNHMQRTIGVELDTNEEIIISYGFDGLNVVISVSDCFGSLRVRTLLEYLNSCYKDKAGTLQFNKGGAGMGLHQIVENSELTIFTIHKNIKTEVVCIWNLENFYNKKQSTSTLHYYFLDY